MNKRQLSAAHVCATACLLSCVSLACSAAPVAWTDWTSVTPGAGGSASGVITLPDASTVNVSYQGGLYFGQTGNSGDIDYWSPNAYTSATVDNAPDSLNSDMLALGTGSAINTLTFSSPMTNPVLSVVSFNGPSWTFDAPFTVLSSGTGYWGTDTLNGGAGNVLSSTNGGEGHGTIQFLGTYSSISWQESGPESWRGITVGAAAPVPLPAAVWLFGSACTGFALVRRRQAKVG
jgi:hypothetical protein